MAAAAPALKGALPNTLKDSTAETIEGNLDQLVKNLANKVTLNDGIREGIASLKETGIQANLDWTCSVLQNLNAPLPVKACFPEYLKNLDACHALNILEISLEINDIIKALTSIKDTFPGETNIRIQKYLKSLEAVNEEYTYMKQATASIRRGGFGEYCDVLNDENRAGTPAYAAAAAAENALSMVATFFSRHETGDAADVPPVSAQ